jgi:hypothetical protein
MNDKLIEVLEKELEKRTEKRDIVRKKQDSSYYDGWVDCLEFVLDILKE